MKKFINWWTDLDGMGAGCFFRSIAIALTIFLIVLTVVLVFKSIINN